MYHTLQTIILRVAALLVALSLVVVSCGKEEAQVSEPQIILISNPVAKTAGSQFMRITVEGSWDITLSYSGSESGWLSLNKTSGTGSVADVLLSYEANPNDDPRDVTITVSNRSYSSSVVLTQLGQKVERNNSGVASTTCGWLELPETKSSDGYDFFAVNMPSSSSGYKVTKRNYSFYWDYDGLVANWVAYPLVKGHMGSSGRSENWGTCPMLSDSQQPILWRAWRESGTYARGHQIPSADRTCDDAANSTTFYYTNMTPQNHTFNSGVWSALEGNVRTWAKKSDTLYVVTGCVTNKSTSHAHDNYSKEVIIPTYYFKAILRYQKNSTVGYSGYAGCGFYMQHSASADAASKSNILSISDLEKKLEYKLFVNLANVVGEDTANKIKNQDPANVSWWTF